MPARQPPQGAATNDLFMVLPAAGPSSCGRHDGGEIPVRVCISWWPGRPVPHVHERPRRLALPGVEPGAGQGLDDGVKLVQIVAGDERRVRSRLARLAPLAERRRIQPHLVALAEGTELLRKTAQRRRQRRLPVQQLLGEGHAARPRPAVGHQMFTLATSTHRRTVRGEKASTDSPRSSSRSRSATFRAEPLPHPSVSTPCRRSKRSSSPAERKVSCPAILYTTLSSSLSATTLPVFLPPLNDLAAPAGGCAGRCSLSRTAKLTTANAPPRERGGGTSALAALLTSAPADPNDHSTSAIRGMLKWLDLRIPVELAR
eukprot:scaffold3859_cov122-Isochrysis_galbana.AAC.3